MSDTSSPRVVGYRPTSAFSRNGYRDRLTARNKPAFEAAVDESYQHPGRLESYELPGRQAVIPAFSTVFLERQMHGISREFKEVFNQALLERKHIPPSATDDELEWYVRERYLVNFFEERPQPTADHETQFDHLFWESTASLIFLLGAAGIGKSTFLDYYFPRRPRLNIIGFGLVFFAAELHPCHVHFSGVRSVSFIDDPFS